MISLRYFLSRNPKNLDDCIDYAHNGKVGEASLKLDTEEAINEMAIVRHLVAQFDFTFSDRLMSCRKILGGCLAHESIKKQISNIDSANKNLSRYLAKIQISNVETRGFEKRFDYSMVYQFSVIKFTPEDAFIPY